MMSAYNNSLVSPNPVMSISKKVTAATKESIIDEYNTAIDKHVQSMMQLAEQKVIVHGLTITRAATGLKARKLDLRIVLFLHACCHCLATCQHDT